MNQATPKIVRDLRVDILCPLDLDFEPDVERLAAEDQTVARVQPGPGGAPAIEMPRVALGHVTLGGDVIAAEASLAARVYRFGTGIVRISFQRDAWDLDALARVAAVTEQVLVDGRTVLAIADAVGEEVRAKLRPYALKRYEVRLPTSEAYPVFRLGGLPADSPAGDAFVEAERRALTAICGVPGRFSPRLSAYALDTAKVTNLGPLVGDVVVIREAGALVHLAADPRGARTAVEEAKRIEGLVELGYAQYWALRSVDELTQRLQATAYKFIESLQERGTAGLVPLREVLAPLYRAREEHMGVTALVDDFLELPAIGYDVYMDAVFREVQDVFGVIERSKLARDRLEDLERSFEVSHQIIAERRLLVIELLVLLVIVLELVLALVSKH